MANNTLEPSKARIDAGRRLQRAMNRRHLTVAVLARRTQLSPGVIEKFLTGERDMHLDDLRVLGQQLGVLPSWIAWGNRGRR